MVGCLAFVVEVSPIGIMVGIPFSSGLGLAQSEEPGRSMGFGFGGGSNGYGNVVCVGRHALLGTATALGPSSSPGGLERVGVDALSVEQPFQSKPSLPLIWSLSDANGVPASIFHSGLG